MPWALRHGRWWWPIVKCPRQCQSDIEIFMFWKWTIPTSEVNLFFYIQWWDWQFIIRGKFIFLHSVRGLSCRISSFAYLLQRPTNSRRNTEEALSHLGVWTSPHICLILPLYISLHTSVPPSQPPFPPHWRQSFIIINVYFGFISRSFVHVWILNVHPQNVRTLLDFLKDYTLKQYWWKESRCSRCMFAP